MVWVDLAAIVVDFSAVDAGGADSGFEVQADAGEVGEHVGAPRAFDIFALVDGGFEVLLQRMSVETLKLIPCWFVRIVVSHHIEVVEIIELAFTSIAVAGRVRVSFVLLQVLVGLEDAVAFIALLPVFLLLVSQAKLPLVSRPAGVAPSTFDFISMSVAIVKVVADAIAREGATAAFRHFERQWLQTKRRIINGIEEWEKEGKGLGCSPN